MQVLYKMDSMGRIRVWDIQTGKDQKGHYYEVSHGVLDGQLQTNRVYVASGKNIGRSNETTPREQCANEAFSEFTQQIERKGYSPYMPTTQPLKPMLAKNWKDEKNKVEYPAAVQVKLDGSRMLAIVTKDGCKLMSRQMKEYFGLDHISQELAPLHKKYGDFILDGEAFSKDLSFQEIMSLVRKTKTASPKSKEVQYWVYDMVSDDIFSQRIVTAHNIISRLKTCVQVPTFNVKSEEDIISRHAKFVKEGYEGTMVRNLSSHYKINSRSSDLLKLKEFIDEEFEIIGFKSGKGKYENVPTFELKLNNGVGNFEAVPIGTEEQRAEYLKNGLSYIGKLATVRFFEYTTSDPPRPRFPVIYDLGRDDV
jgi:ATP-dependent DNA ligase